MLHPLTDPAVVKALTHPLRVQLISLLETDTQSPSNLANLLGEPLGKVSYHIRTLARLGLIELVDSQPRRGAVEHYYRLAKRWLIDAETWDDLPTGVKRSISSSVTHRICTELREADANNAFDTSDAYLTRTPLMLDRQARDELATTLDGTLQKATELERQTLERRAQRAGKGGADDSGADDGSRMLLIVTLHHDTGGARS